MRPNTMSKWKEFLAKQVNAIVEKIFGYLKEQPFPKKIQAIKLYRNATGLDLPEAKRRIDLVVEAMGIGRLNELDRDVQGMEKKKEEVNQQISELVDERDRLTVSIKDTLRLKGDILMKSGDAVEKFKQQVFDDIMNHHSNESDVLAKVAAFDAAVARGQLQPLES